MVSWIFSVFDSHGRQTRASYWTASKKWSKDYFPNRRKWLHSYLDVFQLYSFLIHVPWLLAPPTAGSNGNLIQDGVSFSKIHYLTIVISIFVSQGILIDSTVTSGHLNTLKSPCPVVGDSLPSPTKAQAWEQLMAIIVLERTCQRHPKSPIQKALKAEVCFFFYFLSKFGAIIHLMAKPDLNWCEISIVFIYDTMWAELFKNFAWSTANGFDNGYYPRFCGNVL